MTYNNYDEWLGLNIQSSSSSSNSVSVDYQLLSNVPYDGRDRDRYGYHNDRRGNDHDYSRISPYYLSRDREQAIDLLRDHISRRRGGIDAEAVGILFLINRMDHLEEFIVNKLVKIEDMLKEKNKSRKSTDPIESDDVIKELREHIGLDQISYD